MVAFHISYKRFFQIRIMKLRVSVLDVGNTAFTNKLPISNSCFVRSHLLICRSGKYGLAFRASSRCPAAVKRAIAFGQACSPFATFSRRSLNESLVPFARFRPRVIALTLFPTWFAFAWHLGRRFIDITAALFCAFHLFSNRANYGSHHHFRLYKARQPSLITSSG